MFPSSEGNDHYMVVPTEIDEDKVFAGFKQIGLPSYKYMDGSITKMKSTEQSRPSTLYAIAHKGGAEPDSKHLGRSYNQYSIDGQTYMTIKEYMLVHQFMWWKFNIHLDEKGWTKTSTLDSDGYLMDGGWRGGRFELYDDCCNWRNSGGGPRSVVLPPQY